MCWNATSSLTSFIVGYIVCLILYIRNKNYDRFYSIFFLWILSVQLLEYLMWIDQECKNLNNISNQILCPMILLQPIILSVLSLYFINFDNMTKNTLIISTIISFIIAILSYIIMKPWESKLCSRPDNNNCHSLKWPWLKKNNILNTINYFVLAFIIALILLKTNNFYLIIFVFYLFISLIFSLLIKPFNKSQTSHWCFLAVGLPILKLFF